MKSNTNLGNIILAPRLFLYFLNQCRVVFRNICIFGKTVTSFQFSQNLSIIDVCQSLKYASAVSQLKLKLSIPQVILNVDNQLMQHALSKDIKYINKKHTKKCEPVRR